MKIEDFIQDFFNQLETGEQDLEITAKTDFQKLDDWDSLTALMVLDMIDDKYQVSLTGDELKDSETIQDIFNLILKKS